MSSAKTFENKLVKQVLSRLPVAQISMLSALYATLCAMFVSNPDAWAYTLRCGPRRCCLLRSCVCNLFIICTL